MAALAHYLEEDGIATTGISLIRPHTEALRPPRALWVPFELGRPFGVPGDADFQMRVLRACLGLLARGDGPSIIEDYPEDAPGGSPSAEAEEGWACAVSFPPPPGAEDPLAAALAAEVQRLEPWYALSVETRGRTAVDGRAMDIAAAVRFVSAFLTRAEAAPWPDSPSPDLDRAAALRLAVDDLKSYVMEAATAQPGSGGNSVTQENWFWDATATARAILALRKVLADCGDPALAAVAPTLVPARQLRRTAAPSAGA
ncbi:MAG: hypothetical protein AB7G39_00925 [Alphaproteobacteria bacterium]